MNKRILLIDDDGMLAEAVMKRLSSDGYDTDWVDRGEHGIEKARTSKYDVAILDFKLPGMDGLETLGKLLKCSPDTSVIFFTSYGNHELALRSLQLGAKEYLNKPFNFDNLSFYVYKLMHRQIEFGGFSSAAAADGKAESESMVFRSAAMNKIVPRIPVFASAELPVLISGETGVGKGVMARAIAGHPNNPRAKKPFYVVNCAAIPDSLAESELFGHAKGAFTGALLEKKGFFEEADGGTIFLDEISGATMAVQSKLLCILERGEFYRVGETAPRKTDVVIIAATNKDMFEEMKNGGFRKDLFYRLNGLRIELPPLRERSDDIVPLLEHFLDFANRKYGKNVYFAAETLAMLESADWPGNVRQLKNMVITLVATADKDEIGIENIPNDITASAKTGGEANSPADLERLKEQAISKVEMEYFSNLLKNNKGSVSEAAAQAGISRQSLSKKIKKLGIDVNKYKYSN